MDRLRPALTQHEICQRQVEKHIAAHVIADEVDARQAACQQAPNLLGVVDQDQVALGGGCQPATGLDPHCKITQVGAVAPQAGVQQGFEAHLRSQRR